MNVVNIEPSVPYKVSSLKLQ